MIALEQIKQWWGRIRDDMYYDGYTHSTAAQRERQKASVREWAKARAVIDEVCQQAENTHRQGRVERAIDKSWENSHE